MSARESILAAALDCFDANGFDGSSIAAIRAAAGVSNGSFFHLFPSKDALAAALFMQVLGAYHAALLAALTPPPAACDGVAALIAAHLAWVAGNRREARFMMDQSRSEWMAHLADEKQAENAAFGAALEAWRGPLLAAGHLRPLPAAVFIGQIIGPAQILCRAWLAGRSAGDPREYAKDLGECAIRAVVAAPSPEMGGCR